MTIPEAITNIKAICNRAVIKGNIFDNMDEAIQVANSVKLLEDTFNTLMLDAMKKGELVTVNENEQTQQ